MTKYWLCKNLFIMSSVQSLLTEWEKEEKNGQFAEFVRKKRKKKKEREENHVTNNFYFGNDIVFFFFFFWLSNDIVLAEEGRIDKLKIGKSTKV